LSFLRRQESSNQKSRSLVKPGMTEWVTEGKVQEKEKGLPDGSPFSNQLTNNYCLI
jgi:hypothetical protein